MIDKNKITELQFRLNIKPITGKLDDFTLAAIKNYTYIASKRFDLELIKNHNSNEFDDLLAHVRKRTYADQDEMDKQIKKYSLDDQSDSNDYEEQVEENEMLDISTDQFETFNPLRITKKYLDNDEYYRGSSYPREKYIFIHHTAGWDNPVNQIIDWNNDSRGRVGTHFIIGGCNIATGQDNWDGKTYQAIPTEGPSQGWAYHLGNSDTWGLNHTMQASSISIELCNFGFLNKRGSDYYSWAGTRADSSQVYELENRWRGYKYFHKYSEQQLVTLKALLTSIANKFNIDLDSGLKDKLKNRNVNSAFSVDPQVKRGNIHGLHAHCNVRQDKTDVFPQEELIEMILSL